ncbi:hypothetical protein KFL_002670115 [Klebsormidium nitens]|uniref:CYRIA/CYRIB Rac1 binding domain-containing protein n=1 Tax=Klebsormidium nitens TaxID=105231 RepID=A0A1Y1I6B5_KLENI|nr:hypothetical protein KFL_002670115 [Klebsormidium nitens]|eukprot:GAQ86053.1 hypothetical protein KFL_002670115 [Klebsormidium nitens]
MAPEGVEIAAAVAALATFSIEDEQPSPNGLADPVTVDKSSFSSATGFADVPAFKLALTEDVHGLNQLDALVAQGHALLTSLYTYRSCVKVVPQVPPDPQLYEATFAILRVEVERIMTVHTFQASAARQLCIDMQRFSHPGRHINGPSVAHKWLMLRLLDALLLLDCVKNSKPSLATDFAWYKGLFAQVSNAPDAVNPEADNHDLLQVFLTTRFSILKNLRAELGRLASYDDILTDLLVFCLDTLEAERPPPSRSRNLIGYDRHVLLRAVPTLLVLATPTERQGDKLGRRLHPTRCQALFRRWPVVPAFWDLPLTPAAVVMELSPYFDRLADFKRFDVRPPEDDKSLAEAQMRYLLVYKARDLAIAHDEFCCRLGAAVNQIRLLGDTPPPPSLCSTVVNLTLEGLAFLTDCALAVCEQSAWKYAHIAHRAPVRDPKRAKDLTDYERAVQCNYAPEEKTALLRVIGFLKGVGRALEQSLNLLSPLIFAGIYLDIQNLVQETVHMGAYNRKGDVALLLEQLRAVLGEFTPDGRALVNNGVKVPAVEVRRVRPSAAQMYAIQFLMEELVAGTTPSSSAPSNDPPKELLRWQKRFLRLPHALDVKAHLIRLTDVSELWYREFFLERAGTVQFPIDCSLPWILASHSLTSGNPSLVDNVLLPFDIYNDAGNTALYTFKQRHLYDEVEAEIDLCFDQAVYKFGEHAFRWFKREAARQILDPAVLAAAERLTSVEETGNDEAERPPIRPRYFGLFKQSHVQLLGRSVDVTSLLRQRVSRLFRENVEFLLERLEATGLCRFLEHATLMRILERAHALLSKELCLDEFALILAEGNETVSMTSFSSRIGTQVWSDLQTDLLPSFLFNSATQRFVSSPGHIRTLRPPMPHAQPHFLAGGPVENAAAAQLADLSAQFVGGAHIDAVVEALGKQGLPWLVHQASAHLDHLVTVALPSHARPLFSHIPVPFRPPRKTGMSIEILSGPEAWLAPLLVHPNLEGALQVLKEIGNLLAFVSLLDEAVQTKETRQVLCTAPFIGVVPGREGQLQQLVGRDESAGAPITGLIDRALASVTEQLSAESAVAAQQSSRGSRIAETVYWSCVSAGSLVAHFLVQLRGLLEPFQTDWAPPLGSGRADFAHLYAALHLALCLPVRNGPPQPRWSGLGDSVTLGGLSLVHCLGLTWRWNLADLTRGLARQGVAGALGNRRGSGGPKARDAAAVVETVVHLARVSQRSLTFLATHGPSEMALQTASGRPSSPDGTGGAVSTPITPKGLSTPVTPRTPSSVVNITPRAH